MMSCPDCGENLDEVPVGDPCPACGGSRRSATVAVKAIGATTGIGGVGFRITKDDRRPWTEKWRAVLHSLQALEAVYAGDVRGGNVEVDGRVETFFVECDHLREWLIADVDTLTGVSDEDIKAHWLESQPLQTCNAICNTHKHHTRCSGTTARIRTTEINHHGARVTIEVNWADPAATTVDALDLAQDCVSSWRTFFARFGITEP